MPAPEVSKTDSSNDGSQVAIGISLFFARREDVSRQCEKSPLSCGQ